MPPGDFIPIAEESALVIAEGVETIAQRAWLKRLSCDQIQGYYYSRPLAGEQVLPFVQREFPVAVTWTTLPGSAVRADMRYLVL